jgi:hypothetical protein
MSKIRPHRAGRAAPLLVWTWLLTACVSPATVEKLEGEVRVIQTLVEAQSRELAALREEDRKVWRSLRCSDPQVADFIEEAKHCESGQCPKKNLERVLGFMAAQKHVLIRLRPNQTAADMAPSRVTQLRDILDPRQLTGLSQVLMLSMQLNLGREDPADLADKQAEALLLHTRRTLLLAQTLRHIGPLPVTCQNKSQLLDGYARKFPADQPVSGEPKSKEPQVAVWFFRVDC